MKKIAIICGLVAALLCLTQSAKAQYVQIHRDGAGFVDDRGAALSNQEVRDLVGDDVYFETVVGAQKQYRAGRKLIVGGIIGLGVGYLSAAIGTYTLVESSERMVHHHNSDNYPDRYDYDTDSFGTAVGGLMAFSGILAMAAGSAALSAGVPLKIIGQSRLNWVENDFNDRNRDFSLEFGAAPHGIGLTLKF